MEFPGVREKKRLMRLCERGNSKRLMGCKRGREGERM
jgi:hypothetical protein